MNQKILIVDAAEYNSLIVEPLAELNQKFEQLLNAQHTPETILTRKDAAKFLCVTLVTLNDWTKRGLVDCGRIGTRVYYKRSSLVEAISNFS